ncbi:MAG: InlB B-repeat-containing protein, partial [Kiritimatiellae bacterium]|nr:InlB B-repeat-containing protein [Kiritimatiellia bacterium]
AITGGAYESAGEILYTDETAGSAATISGGTFSSTAADTAFLLNCSDDNKGAIAVTGGSFQGFDPANNAADGADTDYVATGYVSVADDPSSGWYTVYEAVTVTFADDKVAPPEAQVIGKGKTANEPEAPTFTGWTFEGWYTNLVAGEAWDFDDPVVEDITLTAKWTQNEYDVIWVADGAQFASNRVAHGTAMPVPAENPTKSGDDNALYTFVAWTPAQDATVSSNATYTAQFKTWTKVVAPTAAEGLVYDGTEQTGVEAGQGYTLSGDAVGTDAGDYTATASLADAENTVWADATEVNAAATAAKTIDWSIAKAPLSALAVSLQGWTEGKTANTPVVSGNVGGGAETITYWSQDGETQLSGQPTAAGTYTVKVSVPETANYQAGSATASFTIDEIGTYTIIWIAADGSEIDRTTVEEGQMPTHDDPTIADASGGKYAYTFTGWSPALVAATEGATYRATFKTNIAVKLALPLADHAVDATVNGAAATVALAPAGLLEGTEVAATPASAIYAAGTLSFSDLAWNAGTTWTADAAQGEVPLAEAAHNEGTFYAKASTPFFTAAPEQFEAFSDMGAAGVGYANDVASAEGEAVRIHTTIDVPAEGLTSEPEVGDAAAGFAVLQLSGDTAAAFYAYDGTTWTKLLGVTPAEAEGEADYLAVYDFAASPATVRYYIDGVPLYAEGQGGAKNYAIPLPAGMTSLSTIAFGSAEMVKSDVVAVQDVSYVAAVGDTPYTNATDVVTAVGTALASADAATVTLLADDVSGSIELAVGKSVTVVAGSYESGLAFTAADAPTYKVVEAAGDPATTVTYSVELNEATVIWLAENGTELYSTGIVIGTIPVYLGEAQTKAATDAALYTFEGWNDGVQTWTGDLPAVAVGGTNYTAAFKTWTKVDRPAVATGLVYSGEEQTGVTVAAGSAATGTTAATAAGDYSATVALDSADSVWSDATDPADAAARETVTAEWSIARKPVTVAAQAASKVAGNADPELTATVDGTVGSDTVSYTVTRVAGETAGEYEITASGDAEQGNYAVTFTGATFTITGAQVMIISVADAETGATATNYVATLADAVENVASGETIVLLADVGEAIVNTADKAFTIDLNGQTWSSPSDVLTTTAGTITIEATNGGTMTTEAAECCAVWAKGGDVVINGGTFLSKDTKEATIYVSNADSVVTINGGTFQNTAEGDYAYAAGNKVDKPLTLNVKNDLAGEAHIILNGGTFYGNDPMLGDDHIPVTDAAGQFVDPDYFAVSEGGAFTVVERIDIAGAVVTVADGLVYDATAKAGVDSVDYGTTNLVAGTDYVVTYANNVNAGEDTAVATIVGTNLWTGTITTNFSIAKAAATITVTAASKTYGADDPEFAGTVEGLVNEGDLGTVAYSRTGSDENVGTYDDVLTATYTANDNYTVTVVPADFTINAKTLTIVAEAKTQVYGAEAVALTYTSEGLEEGDEITGALTRAEGDDVGTYAISQGTLTAGDNYTIAFTGANYTITKAPVTITVANASKTYGDADPTFTGTVEGLVNAGDLGTIVYSRLNSDEDVGTYEAMLDAEYEANANYEVTLVRGDFTINAKAVTVTVAAKTKEYGDADPELTYEVAGLVNGDTLTGALTRAEGENVGSYAITQGTLAAGGNYTIAFTGANLTITKATATVTAEAKSKTYGDADPELTATVTGLKGEETAAVISYTLSRAEGENAGTYAITPAGDAEQGNYDVVYVPANLTIGAKTLTITVAAKTKE